MFLRCIPFVFVGDLNPHFKGLQKKCYALPHQPGFVYGAPAEFVHLSVLSPDVNHMNYKSKLKEEKYKSCVVGGGLMHSFAVNHSVAHYQGRFKHKSRLLQ